MSHGCDAETTAASGLRFLIGAIALLTSGLLTGTAGAQGPVGASLPSGTFLGGVPSGEATREVLPLSLSETVARGLQHNLAALLGEEGLEAARGARWRALSDVLPHVSLGVSETRLKINLAAFGFSPLPGTTTTIVGPFSVVDARASLTESLIDLHALNHARAEALLVQAARHTYRDTRDRVVLACADLYLSTLAGSSRIESARAQLETAEALYQLALDRKKAGLVPGVDVLRAQVQRDAQRQRLIVAQSQFAKEKLALARAIGLPLGQEFTLTDKIPYAAPPALSLEEARARAYRDRSDWMAATARVKAAELERRAAIGDALPSLDVNADYGTIGPGFSSAQPTFTLGASLRVPLFRGGQAHGKLLEADAALKARRAELEDLRAGIDYEIQTTFLDLTAAQERVHVAEGALDLAQQQVQQARDRFAAGVANSIEVVQSQEALAAAAENYISSLYDHNLAKAFLAQALGGTEASLKIFLGGE